MISFESYILVDFIQKKIDTPVLFNKMSLLYMNYIYFFQF